MNKLPFTRRRTMGGFASWLAAGEPPLRIAPPKELVNAYEFQAMAERKLGSAEFAQLAESGPRAFDRITIRPRMMVNALNLDLTTTLFGEKMFAPILVGPVANQKRFHPDAERATVQGAYDAKAVMVVSSRSSLPFEDIAAASKAALWYQIYPESDVAAARARIAKAVDLGAKAVCITVGPVPDGAVGVDWNSLDRLRQGIRIPVLLKGVLDVAEARTAVTQGFAGIIVSNHGGVVPGLASPIEILPSIAEAVGGSIPILVDGGFRRGTDVLMGLALGARAVLLARPPMWGLAAYGAEGVAILLRLLQTELARNMAMCGKPTIGDIDRSLVTIHRR